MLSDSKIFNAFISTDITAEEYLTHCYKVTELPALPLAEEKFISDWQKAEKNASIEFLENLYGTKFDFNWCNTDAIKISFVQTLAGKLPAIYTENHDDFVALSSFLSGKSEIKKLPVTVNAFTIPVKIRGNRHRMILLNKAPYSNISADKLNLNSEDWIEKSKKIRCRHESAHYETLRFFGGMKNHALDEILADTLGQIAAFGNFSANRQRLFFGLNGSECTGRLQFYCQKVSPEDREKIYKAVDAVLDKIESEIAGCTELEIFCKIAGKSIADRL